MKVRATVTYLPDISLMSGFESQLSPMREPLLQESPEKNGDLEHQDPENDCSKTLDQFIQKAFAQGEVAPKGFRREGDLIFTN